MATFSVSIMASDVRASSARWASSIIIAVVMEICFPTVYLTFLLLKLYNSNVAKLISLNICMYSKWWSAQSLLPFTPITSGTGNAGLYCIGIRKMPYASCSSCYSSSVTAGQKESGFALLKLTLSNFSTLTEKSIDCQIKKIRHLSFGTLGILSMSFLLH